MRREESYWLIHTNPIKVLSSSWGQTFQVSASRSADRLSIHLFYGFLKQTIGPVLDTVSLTHKQVTFTFQSFSSFFITLVIPSLQLLPCAPCLKHGPLRLESTALRENCPGPLHQTWLHAPASVYLNCELPMWGVWKRKSVCEPEKEGACVATAQMKGRKEFDTKPSVSLSWFLSHLLCDAVFTEHLFATWTSGAPGVHRATDGPLCSTFRTEGSWKRTSVTPRGAPDTIIILSFCVTRMWHRSLVLTYSCKHKSCFEVI